jgi:glycosyltransferase involved in cell wall biosynthesis
MNKKILYIVPPTRTFAGIERVIDEICSELAHVYKETFDVDVLHLSNYRNHVIGERNYNKIQRLTDSRRDLISNIRNTVKEKNYDLVVVPQIEAAVVSWFCCLGLRRKIVLYLHGNYKLENTHTKARILFYVMRKFIIHQLSGVFGTSPKQLDSFKGSFPSNIPHYWTPNPVRKFEEPTKNKVGESEDRIVFVNVGRFSVQKGQDILIDAFAMVYSVRSDVRLKLVGFGDREKYLRKKIGERGLDGVVSIEYHPSNPYVALSQSDIYVSSSRWEGWSLTICEALRFGLPVVALDCEFGPSDILADRRLGILVSPESEDELVNSMLYYCNNLDKERQHAEYRRNYIDRYSVEHVIKVHAGALLRSSLDSV